MVNLNNEVVKLSDNDLRELRVLSKQTLEKSEARERKCQEEKERLNDRILELRAQLQEQTIACPAIETKDSAREAELEAKEAKLGAKEAELVAKEAELAEIRAAQLAELARIRAELAAKDAAKDAETKKESKGESKEGTKEGTKDKNVDSTLFWVLLGSVLGEDDLKKQKQSST